MKLIAGTSNPLLAQKVSEELGIKLCESTIRRFADGEIFAEIQENIRGEDMFVLQSTCSPTNDNLMELLVVIDALKRSSAQRITAVVPYFGYARQDRKSGPRTPITAKLVANLIMEAGADRVLTMDLHAMQIQGFFDIPTDNLYAAPLFAKDIKERFKLTGSASEGAGEEIMVVSPDVGGVVRARQLATRINKGLAIIDKRREKAGVSEVMNVIGDVKGKVCIMVDDIVDSGGSLCNAAQALMDCGAVSVEAYATHGVLSGEALERIEKSPIKRLTLTDTIPAPANEDKFPTFHRLTTADLLARAIRAITEESSISALFV